MKFRLPTLRKPLNCIHILNNPNICTPVHTNYSSTQCERHRKTKQSTNTSTIIFSPTLGNSQWEKIPDLHSFFSTQCPEPSNCVIRESFFSYYPFQSVPISVAVIMIQDNWKVHVARSCILKKIKIKKQKVRKIYTKLKLLYTLKSETS